MISDKSSLAFSRATNFEQDLPDLPAIRQKLANWRVPTHLRLHREIHQTRRMRNDQLSPPNVHFQRGAMIEVFHQGTFAYAGTADLSAAGLQAAHDRALSMAENLASARLTSFPSHVRPFQEGFYESPGLSRLHEIRLTDIDQTLAEANRALKHSPVVTQRISQIDLTEAEIWNLTNHQGERRQRFALWVIDGSATAEKGTETQVRSLNGSHSHCYQGGLDILDRARLRADCERTGLEATQLLSAANCPSGSFDVVLAADQMLLQIHESIGHPLELDRILGDERNYAGWSFVRLEDFGRLQYGSELLNVSFDPTRPEEFASYGFDESGAPAERQILIEKGRLVRGLGSLESQARAGVPGVANFRSAAWNRAPIDRMANINIEPGHTPFEDLIAQVEDGLYLQSNRSWSIDDYRDKFQFGCEIGYRIRGGKLAEVVKNPNYRGRTLDFWRSLKSVGDRDTFRVFGSPFCGKGEPSQVIRVGHASPACLFQNLQTFGGGPS